MPESVNYQMKDAKYLTICKEIFLHYFLHKKYIWDMICKVELTYEHPKMAILSDLRMCYR